jgi:predicted porin
MPPTAHGPAGLTDRDGPAPVVRFEMDQERINKIRREEMQMQLKPIAPLIACLMAAPAFAQSNVTIYGRADYGLMSRSGDNGAVPPTNGKTEFASGIAGASRIGFRGSEDLGNGLKAIFEIEYATALDSGTTTSTTWGNRHSWVGLTGDFGTVIGGRIDGLRYNKMFSVYDPFGVVTLGNIQQLSPNRIDRYDNSVMYISPAFSGLTATVAYSTQVRGQEGANSAPHGGNDGDNRLMAAGLSYDNGPLSLGASYENVNTQGIPHSTLWTMTLGAAYDFGVVKLSALYDKIKADDANTLVSGQDQSLWLVGVKAPVGQNVVLRAVYGNTSYDKYQGKNADDLDASKWAVGADYKLSKRTNFYADYGSIHNDSNAANTIGPAGTNYLNGYGVRGFDLGITHKF